MKNSEIKACIQEHKRYLDGIPAERADFSQQNLSSLDIHSTDLRRANFTNCNLIQAKFDECNLMECDFTGANLSSADFINCNLSMAVFKQAVMHGVRFKNCKLVLTHFESIDSDVLDFENSDYSLSTVDESFIKQRKEQFEETMETIRLIGPENFLKTIEEVERVLSKPAPWEKFFEDHKKKMDLN